jgi:hypothetical protein
MDNQMFSDWQPVSKKAIKTIEEGAYELHLTIDCGTYKYYRMHEAVKGADGKVIPGPVFYQHCNPHKLSDLKNAPKILVARPVGHVVLDVTPDNVDMNTFHADISMAYALTKRRLTTMRMDLLATTKELKAKVQEWMVSYGRATQNSVINVFYHGVLLTNHAVKLKDALKIKPLSSKVKISKEKPLNKPAKFQFTKKSA